jgi:hypothetical protein
VGVVSGVQRGVDGPNDGKQQSGIVATHWLLERYLGAFAVGHMNLLILVGAMGLAKSRTVRRLLGKKTAWIEGSATPFAMYRKL